MAWTPGQPVRIEGEGYLVRSLTPLDVERGYAEWHEDPELAVLVGLPQGLSVERHQHVLSFADNRTRFMLGVCKGLNEQLIGLCKVNVSPQHKRGHLTIVIAQARHRRQGAAKAPVVHDFLFEALQLNKVEYQVRAGNGAALALLGKHGVVQEVLYREHDRLPNGQFVDVHGFGLLKTEWLATKKGS